MEISMRRGYGLGERRPATLPNQVATSYLGTVYTACSTEYLLAPRLLGSKAGQQHGFAVIDMQNAHVENTTP